MESTPLAGNVAATFSELFPREMEQQPAFPRRIGLVDCWRPLSMQRLRALLARQ
jgi:hypothetical protein